MKRQAVQGCKGVVQPDSSNETNSAAALEQAFEAAISLHEQQRLVEAEKSYRLILQADPTHFGALQYLGMLCAQRRSFDEAVALLRRAIKQDPESGEAHDHLGSVLQALGRHAEAIVCHEAALAIDSKNPEAHYNLGVALQALNRHEAATVSYRRALALAPSIAEIHYNAATAHTALKQHHAALEHYEKALAIRPDYVRARTGLASTLQALGRHRESVAHYKTVLDAQPDDAQSRNSLGAGLQMLGRQEEAVAEYRRALALRPDYAEAHNNLGLALQALDRHAEALPCHERALAIAPGYAAAHNNLGSALQALDRHDEALAQYRRALAIRPENASAQANIGLALQEIGRIEDACQAFQRAIELQPRSARFYRNLADCKRFTRDDAQLAAMEALGADVDSLPDDEQRQLHFALGKAFADVGEYDRSFRHLLAGNRLKRQQIVYDEPAVLAEFDRIRMVFSRELMTRYAGLGHPSASPVFILGMPRSGSTLVEQILASHPSVFGAGERLDFGEEVARLSAAGGPVFPEIVAALGCEDLEALGARYLRRVSVAAPGAERITDKMPFNFLFAGLIHLALPNARIIHTRRDPLDTCLSCFSKLFTGEHRCAYDLAELGRYYRTYESLMAHWRKVLPTRVMLDVQYEDVVADLEPQARRIVAHCGLEWDDACLAFRTNPRPVRTASAVQVREPIHGGSIGRWRRYGELLTPLLEGLGLAAAEGRWDHPEQT
jgi:tetratricopeptide (TPR) repeat protein